MMSKSIVKVAAFAAATAVTEPTVVAGGKVQIRRRFGRLSTLATATAAVVTAAGAGYNNDYPDRNSFRHEEDYAQAVSDYLDTERLKLSGAFEDAFAIELGERYSIPTDLNAANAPGALYALIRIAQKDVKRGQSLKAIEEERMSDLKETSDFLIKKWNAQTGFSITLPTADEVKTAVKYFHSSLADIEMQSFGITAPFTVALLAVRAYYEVFVTHGEGLAKMFAQNLLDVYQSYHAMILDKSVQEGRCSKALRGMCYGSGAACMKSALLEAASKTPLLNQPFQQDQGEQSELLLAQKYMCDPELAKGRNQYVYHSELGFEIPKIAAAIMAVMRFDTDKLTANIEVV